MHGSQDQMAHSLMRYLNRLEVEWSRGGKVGHGLLLVEKLHRVELGFLIARHMALERGSTGYLLGQARTASSRIIGGAS